MSINTSIGNSISKRKMLGKKNELKKTKWFNDIVFIYVGIVILIYLLMMIAPFKSAISKTPLYHISAYLGALGGLLILFDAFIDKGFLRGTHCILLFGICVIACLSAIRTKQYGLHDNIYDICWVCIQFALVYSCAFRAEKQQIFKFCYIVFPILICIWFVACSVSLYQFIYQIGYRYIVDTVSTNPELTRQGFYNHRLFGIFTGLDYAVYISLALSICSVYFWSKTKLVIKKIVLSLMLFAFLMHIILSGSRSVQISLILYVFFFAWLQMRNHCKVNSFKQIAIRCIASILVAAISVAAIFGLKELAQRVPNIVNTAVIVQKDNENSNSLNKSTNKNEDSDDLLEREGLEGDISNERFDIWKDYIGLYKDISFVGLSLSNYNDYIMDKYPNLYITQYFQEDYGNSQKTDIVYESHNNYIFVFVSVGVLGMLLFIAYMLIVAVQTIKYICINKQLSQEFIAALAIVCIGLVEALFMNSVFLKINAPSFLFWLAIGYLMYEISNSNANQATEI